MEPKSKLLGALAILGRNVLLLWPSLLDSRTCNLLDRAGYRHEDDRPGFIGLKLSLLFLAMPLACLFFASLGQGILLIIPFSVLVWLLPNFFLSLAKKN